MDCTICQLVFFTCFRHRVGYCKHSSACCRGLVRLALRCFGESENRITCNRNSESCSGRCKQTSLQSQICVASPHRGCKAPSFDPWGLGDALLGPVMANSRFEYVKGFETDDRLLPGCWIVVRLDGKGFTKYASALADTFRNAAPLLPNPHHPAIPALADNQDFRAGSQPRMAL